MGRVRGIALGLVCTIMVCVPLVAGCAGSEETTSLGSSASVTLPPQPLPHPDIFADPQQPVLDSSGNLAPDARRVLTVLALRMSLDEFRQANGHYPASLDELFPTYAPLDDQGQVMTGVPQDAGSIGYQYTRQGDGYQLSVKTSKGEYLVTGPGGGS